MCDEKLNVVVVHVFQQIEICRELQLFCGDKLRQEALLALKRVIHEFLAERRKEEERRATAEAAETAKKSTPATGQTAKAMSHSTASQKHSPSLEDIRKQPGHASGVCTL